MRCDIQNKVLNTEGYTEFCLSQRTEHTKDIQEHHYGKHPTHEANIGFTNAICKHCFHEYGDMFGK